MSDLHHLACPACGSEHLHWELHRLRTRTATLQMRVIHWLCRDCGQSWIMPTSAAGGAERIAATWSEATARSPG